MRRLCLLFLLVAPLAWVQVSWAQEPYPLSDEDKKIVEMSRSILQSAVDGSLNLLSLLHRLNNLCRSNTAMNG